MKTFYVLLFAIFLLGCAKQLDDQDIKGTPGFVMSKNLVGSVVKSSDKKEIGKKISFINLHTESPGVLFESGGTSPMQKIFEDDKILVIQQVASGTGSIDTFLIDKKTGKFARTASGSLAGIYAHASIGICK